MNAFQRRYFAWAEPRYAKMQPELCADARRLDRWLYSRAAIGLWLGLLAAVVASVAALMFNGFPFLLALVCSMTVWIGLPIGALGAWLQPHKFTARNLLRKSVVITALGYAGAFVGFLVGRLVKHGGLKTETLGEALWTAARLATPILVVGMLGLLLLMWGVAQARSAQDRRELARLSLVQERDAAARQAAESRLHLLQAQIQPHFLFNTLAALQHWVDSGDTRAGPLLRDLTGFLRGSTTLLARAESPLADEAETARQYLRILQARLGTRLAFEITLDDSCGGRSLPAGILLTLVENAVEHGITPALHGGTVRVAAHCDDGSLVLDVCDDGAGLDPAAVDGVGLANCRARLQHRYGGAASLELQALQPGTRARVTVSSA
jgi:signal transduction histidine kinase